MYCPEPLFPAAPPFRPTLLSFFPLLFFFFISCAFCSIVFHACSPSGNIRSSDNTNRNNHTPGSGEKNTIRILTFGDSITQGIRYGVNENETFSSLLEKQLQWSGFTVTVIRSGVSGETVSGALKRISGVILQHQPHIVTVMYGTNDAFVDVFQDSSDTSPRVPLPEYERDLLLLVKFLKENNIRTVLMTSIPMSRVQGVYEQGVYKGKNINFLLRDYIRTVRRIAVREHIPLADHFRRWSAFQQQGGDIGTLTTDHLHPNPDGHRMIMTAMIPILTPILKELEESPGNQR